MAIIMKLEIPGGTLEQYDRTNEILHIEGEDDAPDGLVQHVCGATDDGIVIIDVWDSEDSLNRFYEERLGAALREVGLPQTRPEIVKLHNSIPKGSGTEPNTIVITEVEVGTDVYDQLVEAMDAHLEGGDHHPSVSHFAGAKDDGGMLVVDLWGSAEAFEQFAQEQIAPIASDRMGEVQPRFVPVHNLIRGRATVNA